MHLTPAVVQDIHKKGGTILVSDRGNPPHLDIAKMLQREAPLLKVGARNA